MIYTLVILVLGATNQSGRTSLAIDFNTRPSCEAAAKQINSSLAKTAISVGTERVVMTCIEKPNLRE